MAATAFLSKSVNTVLGLCGGMGQEEQAELRPKEKTEAPAPKGMFDQLSSRVMALAGREAPDAEFEQALRLLSEPTLLSVCVQNGPAEMSRFAVSRDGAMLTWQTLELRNNLPKASGAIALASITRVERPPVGRMSSWLGRAGSHLIAIHHSTPSEEVRIEVSGEQQRDEYASALDRVSTKLRTRLTESRAQGKIARHAQKEMELMGKRQAAEKRKAEIMQSMQGSGGGMKHTAVAMATRS